MQLDPTSTLPADGTTGALLGRVWRPDVAGPSVVAIRADGVHDVSLTFPTMRDLCEADDPAAAVGKQNGEKIGDFAAILANTAEPGRNEKRPWFLAPIDL